LKSRKALLRVLLDTSFILPTLGIDVGEEALMGLRKLTEAKTELYYSRFSILESLWIAARLSTSFIPSASRSFLYVDPAEFGMYGCGSPPFR